MKFQVLITFNDNVIHEKIYNSLNEVAKKAGLIVKLLFEEDHHYLAELTLMD